MLVTPHDGCWVSPFGHPRITARLPAPRGLSQAPTSFIGSWCQGIHRMPLQTCQQYIQLKMLASTVQFSNYERETSPTPGAYPHPPPTEQTRTVRPEDQPVTRDQPTPNPQASVPSGPNSVPGPAPPTATTFHTTPTRKQDSGSTSSTERRHEPHHRCSTLEQPPRDERPSMASLDPTPPTQTGRQPWSQLLLRKEVIQPHLPVRLPCYDFVPIASPTFDGSPPQGVGPPASGVTDFRDVTGGVYKARERIHRSVADLRLLATPTSRGRVADPDPN